MKTPRDDRDLRAPAQLMPPRVSVVRLNRRLLYVIDAALVIVVVAGLVALRAEGSRWQEAGPARASQFSLPSGGRWFDKIPDREPSAPPVMKQIDMPVPSPPPAVTPPPLPIAAAPEASTEAELEATPLEAFAVNLHLVRVFGNALPLSVISAGVQLGQIPDFGRGFAGPNAGNVLGAAVGQELGQTASELIRRGINVAPTLEIRPGYAFNVMVTQDLVFPGPYDDTVRP
jgi:type IV secretory pathway VirB10-like protein